MTSTLQWTANDNGLSFTLRSAEVTVPISRWAHEDIVTRDAEPANIAPLMRSIDATLADTGDELSVSLSNVDIEGLGETQLAQLGLPPAAPLRLKMRGKGLITSPDFQLQQQLTRHDGKPVMGARRTGALIRAGNSEYTLLFPLYSLISEIAAFNAQAGSTDAESRMLHWAKLKELLPDTAEIDNQLRTVNIVRADAFTLDTNVQGDITPLLRHRKAPDASYNAEGEDAIDAAESDSFEPALPPASQRSFADRFQRASQVSRHYVTEDHWYIALPPVVTRALRIVKEYQQRPKGERLAFIANPKRAIVAALEDEFTSEELDTVFEETEEFLSQRVRCLGFWEPKAFAYSLPGNTDWFPNEGDAGGFLVDFGDQLVPVGARETKALAQRMREAIDAGQSEIAHGEYRIPVSEDSLERLETAAAEQQRSQADKKNKDNEFSTDGRTNDTSANDSGFTEGIGQQETDEEEDSRVPLIEDNLRSLGYLSRPHKPRGTPGGLPAVLQTTSLYPHQTEGLRWLQDHWANGSNGALLADDMGLGKTLQTLAFLAWVQEQEERCGRRLPFLVVAPTGLLRNWEAEEQAHLARPGLGELCYAYGSRLKDLASQSNNERKASFARAGWVMTTYETLRDKIRLFVDVKWGVVVFDEVQKIKNPVSLTHDMAKSVGADFFLALTGTPVENRVSDLWSVIDAIAPGQLGSLKDFQATYEDTSAPTTLDTKIERLQALREELLENNPPPRILRRMKAQQLTGLPRKDVHHLKALMPTQQAAEYERVLATLRANADGRSRALTALQHLRRVSLMTKDIAEKGIDDATVQQSARLKVLIDQLDRIHAAGEKALVFVEYRSFQDHLVAYLQRRYDMKRPPTRINGQTNPTRRKKIVDEFQKSTPGEFNVIVLSPKAAGVGITLTAANHVIHLSRWWNPAVEDQCTDRIFRIGQKRPVHVYFPMAIHPNHPDTSFDVNLDALLERKRSLSSGLLTPADASDTDLSDLLNNSLQ